MAKVLISVKDKFLDEIDRVAESVHSSRSEFIREALRHYMRTRVKVDDFVSVESVLLD